MDVERAIPSAQNPHSDDDGRSNAPAGCCCKQAASARPVNQRAVG